MRWNRGPIERFTSGIAVILIHLLVWHLRTVACAGSELAGTNLLIPAGTRLAVDLFTFAYLPGRLVRLVNAVVAILSIREALTAAVGIDVAIIGALAVTEIIGV